MLPSTGIRVGRFSSVGIATGYGLKGPGIESRWRQDFSLPVQTGPGAHPASCTMGTGSFPGGKERSGLDADPSPASSAVGHERVELYLYSRYGPYGLYRASVPVQGVHLSLAFIGIRTPDRPPRKPVAISTALCRLSSAVNP